MNPVADEIRSYIGNSDKSVSLAHYGMPKRSGRYPYGSGEDPYQHSGDFLSRVEEMRKAGFTYTDDKGKTWKGDTAIAKSMGLSSTQFRAEIGIATDTRRMYQVSRAKALKEKGLGNTAIGREMGISESTVRSLLDPQSESRMKAAKNAAEFIKQRVDEKGMVDVGVGTERELNLSAEKLDQALYLLQREGYELHGGRTPQITNPGQMTTLKVICKPGTPHREIFDHPENISSLKEYITRDEGVTFEKKFNYPTSIDSKRVKVLLGDEIGPDGEPGIAKDGVIQLRRGVPDLSLGESRYSQVRILVDGDKYLKGMAVYSDNMPDGIDVVFNSNKKTVDAAYKKIKTDDPDNPFGSLIKDADQGGQYWYDPKTGQRVSANTPGAKLGAINKRADEGDWSEWKDAVPSQFLSKQPISLAKKQLKLAQESKQEEFDEYCNLTNPTIKKHLLNKFADECDSAATHLQAAALPGQKYHVIIPNNTLKDDEIYAPGYENGTQLALVRYPHGGTFEIPICTVNNKNRTGKNILGSTPGDAVCINSKVAERLSGADFDGDTVMCIPTNTKGVKIKSTRALKGLEGFDPKVEYGPDTYDSKTTKLMTKAGTQKQMGVISNLITDMTLAGATQDELAAAVRHSMVVIDAEKHKLNYRQSEIDNNIAALHKKYQGKTTGGAATIISKAKGEYTVAKRQGTPKLNVKKLKNGEPNPDYDPSKPEGSLIWKPADDLYYPVRKYDKSTGTVTVKTTTARKSITYNPNDPDERDYYEPRPRTNKDGSVTYTNKDGSIIYKTDYRKQKSTKMAEVEDAYQLVSEGRYQMELVYADHANYMKDLARQARLEAYNTGKVAYSAQAKATYAKEVRDLDDKLNDALLNAPRERLAQVKAHAETKSKLANNPNIEKKDEKKIGQQALKKYREEAGSVARSKRSIQITDREWEAIQAGAISESKLVKILANTDVDSLRQRATPRSYTTVNSAKASRIKAMAASGKTLSEIAKAVGVSTSTVSEYLSN